MGTTIEGARAFTIEARHLLHRGESAEENCPLIVALHGQGMTAPLFSRILRHLDVDRCMLLVPEGPYPFEVRSSAGNSVGHGWYIYTGDQPSFRVHLERSEEHVVELVREACETQPIDPSRITLLGYSQGGYLAGFTALRRKELFRGLVLASTRLKHEFLAEELAAGDVPQTLFVHSQQDPSVQWERVEEGIAALRAAGGDVEVHLHDEGHRLPAEGVKAIDEWLQRKGLRC